MRIFAGLLGGLFLLLGIVGLGGGAVLVLGTSYDDPTYTCSSTTGGNALPLTCETYGDSATGHQTYALGAAIGGGSLVVGGCALLAGAVAAGRKPPAVAYQQARAAAGGPPPGLQGSPGASGPSGSSGGSFDSGWQTTQQPPGGDARPRS